MLLDTSGLLCLVHRSEPFHVRAQELYRGSVRRVTHNYIVSEWVALAQARGVPRPDALRVAASFRADPSVELVWVDPALHDAGLALLRARPDKEYSLCDAVSFVLMRRLGLTEALTTDHHFDQEGFRRLLK